MNPPNLEQYLSACQDSYKECIDVIEHSETINGVNTNLRFHHLKFDGNSQPMIGSLAETLYRHIMDYCISAKERPNSLTSHDAMRLAKQARQLFRHPKQTETTSDTTGEAGEILLYFLLESVLKAPQIVAKMDLKTNPKLEINGSDGIHMHWNENDNLIDVFFGEAKLYQSYGKAMKDALTSINSFHDENMLQHEFWMVTKHFKYADDATQKAILELVNNGTTNSGIRTNHACLIGYDSINYKNLSSTNSSDITKEFKDKYLQHAKKLTKKFQTKFDKFDKKHLNFEVFFIPFPSVQEFRDAFNKALN